jgi:hypothetical protein
LAIKEIIHICRVVVVVDEDEDAREGFGIELERRWVG